jgi:glycosyltransferase involved in cell wall biosynthesis
MSPGLLSSDRFPRVSVVVPCFNEAPELIRESLGSLRAQSFTDFECLVIDESTQPELAEACRAECARDTRFTYVHPSGRLGLAASLNLGVELSRGEYVARFDSDDICLPERLTLQVRFLDDHPEIGVLGGAMDIINESGQTIATRLYPCESTAVEWRMQVTNAIAHPTVMARRQVFEQHGHYDSSFRFSEDLELWLRWLNAGVTFANLPQVLIRYRQNSTNRSSTHWKYNLRARRRHLSANLLPHRLVGMIVILAWMAFPDRLKDQLFRKIVFYRNMQP